jgi:putative hemolysin
MLSTSMSPVAWAVISFLILVNGLYVAAEFGIIGARRGRIRSLAADGNRLAARLLPAMEDPRALDRYIAASQIGITLSSLLLGAYAERTLAPALTPYLAGWDRFAIVGVSSAAILVTLVGLAAVQLVIGELVPKALALQFPTRTALVTVLPMQWSLRLFAWFITILNGSGLVLLRLLGLTYTGHRHVHSPEEIELLIAESRDGGLLEPEEHARLHRALRLGLRTARELMVPRERIAAVAVDTPFDRVLARLAESPYTRLPVYESTIDDAIGLLHAKDVALAFTREGAPPPLTSLVKPIARVGEEMLANHLLAFLRDHRTPLALVVDRRGNVTGLVTLEDVLTELIGGVADEFKAGAVTPAAGKGRDRA